MDSVRGGFCLRCGQRLVSVRRGGRERLTCPSCGWVFFKNPAVGVAVVLRDASGRVLLGRRLTTYAGKWCLPCGYVEWGEDVRQAAIREFKEETGLEAELGEVFAVHSNFHDRDRLTVGIWFLCSLVKGEARPGDDLVALGYFELDALPDLAFPTDARVLDDLRRWSGENRA